MIGEDTMQKLICNNNQYLKSITSVPIYGLPKTALMIEILLNEEANEKDQIQMMVIDYILSADWCYGLKPTNSNGKYFLITSIQQLSEV